MAQQPETNFTQTLESALKHYQDAAWLGEWSPLASHYLLGAHLAGANESMLQRGQTLQKVLADATRAITGDKAERYQTILRDYYFADRPAAVVWDQIGLTKNSFHLNRHAAIAALETKLLQMLQPVLRLEQPPLAPALVEREEQLGHCQKLLTTARHVALVGTAGIGKTALAAQLAQRTTQPLFWYMVRPGLNDQPSSLLFALALFAHRHGASTLWLALATNPRQPIDETLLSALRYVLGQIEPMPLLCIDGLESLQPTMLAQHQAFVHCLDSLRGVVPALLIGQQMPLEGDAYVTPNALSVAGVSQLLLAHLGRASGALRAELHQLTQGNPRLLKLCLAALTNGETIDDLHGFLRASATADLLLRQTMTRLPERERQLMMALSVFRSPSPLPHAQEPATTTALANLQSQGLIQLDRQGAAEVPPLYRELLLRQMDGTTVHQLHGQAARVRSALGAYTAAAYHWVEAGQPDVALTLWRHYGEQEIAQGQAATALALFHHVRRLVLPQPAHEQATLICAQLEHFTGYSEQAVATLSTLLSKTPILTVESATLAGTIANDHSNFSHADDAFQRALQVAEQLVEVRLVQIYNRRAWMHLRQRELDQAEAELQRAEFEVANMRGNLALDRCQYSEAAAHYQTALQVAEVLDLPEAIGKCTNNLAGVALFQGNFAEAMHYLQRAGRAYARIGKVAAEAGSKITLAVAHNQAGDHMTALTVLGEAERLLTSRDAIQPWQQALLAQARAEAYLGLGDWVATEEWVRVAIAAEEVSVLPDSYRVYGELCMQREAYDEAKQFLEQSLSLAEANEDQYLAAYAWRALGMLYRALGQGTQAIAARNAAIALFEAMNLAHEIEQCRNRP